MSLKYLNYSRDKEQDSTQFLQIGVITAQLSSSYSTCSINFIELCYYSWLKCCKDQKTCDYGLQVKLMHVGIMCVLQAVCKCRLTCDYCFIYALNTQDIMCEVVIGLYCSCINEFSAILLIQSIMNFTYVT